MMSPMLSVVPSLERAFLSLVWRSDRHDKVQLSPIEAYRIIDLAPVVQTLHSAIHWINHYPLDNSIGFASVYPLDSDLSGGQRYPLFEQLGPGF